MHGPKEKNAWRGTCAYAQVRLNTGAVLKGCHQFCTHLPARAILVPRIGFPRVYTLAVNAGGRSKAHPPGPADATPALQGSASGKRSRECPDDPNPRATHAAGRDFPDFYRTFPPRGVFFSWTVHGPFSFWQDQKENGGGIPRRQSRHRPRAASARKIPRL